MATPTTMGERIAALRRRRNMTQKELAERADLSIPFVSDIENDKRNISSAVLLDLAEALDASLDYLMKGEGEDGSGEGRDEKEPRSIPPALARAAQRGDWSYSETTSLLEAVQMVHARRSKRGAKRVGEMTEEDWHELYRRLFDG